MPTNAEIRSSQTTQLFELLMIKNENKGMDIKRLDELIAKTEAGMTKEDVAWVEQKIERLNK
ncbi:MAG: hypothetical protein FWG63_01550 [Defluviitaleaceae bacterium]|nr:hypothetical protein [Defluviitaleaceae bacterium]